MTSVHLEQIGKTFGSVTALEEIQFQVAPGEMLFLLGPSGCGKSTLLRLIAGLLEPTTGRIIFDGRDVTSLGTQQRGAVMCFQNYALWPHLTVRQNVRFGLKVRDMPPAQCEQRVGEVLRLVQLGRYADRKPNSLSGGQQQRAALARALAVRPQCLLLDEPLSNLDAKMRLEMRGEIRRICKEAGVTTIYVTHDQKEALSIADRIVLLRQGRVEQVGTPAELYYKPRTSFAADFIGLTNLIHGQVVSRNGRALRVETALGTLSASSGDDRELGRILLSMRPEQFRVVSDLAMGLPGVNRMTGKVLESTFMGEFSEHVLEINGRRLKLTRSPPLLNLPPQLVVEIAADDVVVLTE
jgi:iron(III) transport system ATP-binding protein